MKNWFKNIAARIGRGKKSGSGSFRGVDSGREAFVKLRENEKKQTRNLLRKLNQYWHQRRDESHKVYTGEKKKHSWIRLAVLVLSLCGAAALFLKAGGVDRSLELAAKIDFFRIAQIQVQGCLRSSAAEVRTSSGVIINSSLFAVDPKEVARAVTDQNPWIKEVEVVKRWPDVLLMKIQEYEPYAIITRKAGENSVLYYLDRNGDAFIRIQDGMDMDYPVITGLETIDDHETHRSSLDQALYFLRLVGANNPNLPAQSVSEIHIDPEKGLIIHLVEHPFPIFFGNDNVRQKYVRLRKVLEVLYKPRKTGMNIARVVYIRMDYLKDKVIVGYTESG